MKSIHREQGYNNILTKRKIINALGTNTSNSIAIILQLTFINAITKEKKYFKVR